jgi:iron only hydrogenase large subunit-like protein
VYSEAKAKVMIAATAPAVRIGIGEEFGFEVGTNSERKLVTALRTLGFDYVFGESWPYIFPANG